MDLPDAVHVLALAIDNARFAADHWDYPRPTIEKVGEISHDLLWQATSNAVSTVGVRSSRRHGTHTDSILRPRVQSKLRNHKES